MSAHVQAPRQGQRAGRPSRAWGSQRLGVKSLSCAPEGAGMRQGPSFYLCEGYPLERMPGLQCTCFVFNLFLSLKLKGEKRTWEVNVGLPASYRHQAWALRESQWVLDRPGGGPLEVTIIRDQLPGHPLGRGLSWPSCLLSQTKLNLVIVRLSCRQPACWLFLVEVPLGTLFPGRR